MHATRLSAAPCVRAEFGRFGGPQAPGIHAVVIALLCHPVTGALIRLMGALGFGGWATTYLL